ncbi:MAG: ABC transporter permease [Opitutaceae bacterium]|nr:ABC transporter permease [Opitutaceae bacterium]
MNASRYVFLSVLHHRFAYLGVLAGAVLGATVLLGALFAGDSVERSLRQIAANRTGRVTHLVAAGDRFFRQALADDLGRAAGARVAPVLYARGTVSHAATRGAANQVQLVGVSDTFWQLAPKPTQLRLDSGKSEVAINDTLARRLNAKIGDTIILRLQKPGILSGNAPVAGTESKLETLRGTVAAVVDDASFGRFSLESTQVAQPSVFLPLTMLQQVLDRAERANLLLIETARPAAEIQRALASSVQLADYGLTLKWLDAASAFELTSNRIFIDPEIAGAVSGALPTAQPVLSYLVNEFRVRDKATPYSIATATTADAAPFLPRNLGDQEIVLNDWLAQDLNARTGDDVRLTYFQTGEGGALLESAATFRVRAITPLEGLAADRAWMPDFPGMTDVERAADWDPGLPLDLKRIRDQDERYWNEHRGAPKAFLSLAGGRALWSTRWGNSTALRIRYDRARESELAASALAALRPEMNQLLVRDFGASATDAARSPVDFGGLFIGMSFFLIVASLGLVAMLFQLALLERNREDALLGAVGLRPRLLLRWRLGEGFVILLVAGAVGLGLATLYTRGILRFLESIWAGQAASPTFVFAATPASIAIGSVVFLALSLLAIWFAIRKQTRRALSIRLLAHAEEIAPAAAIRRSSIAVAGFAAAVALVAVALSGRALPAQAAFYIAGFALLAAGIAVCRWWMARAAESGATVELNAVQLGRLNVTARRTRSLTVVGLIATAVFMVLSVASFRKHVGDDWLERGSGTGGFAFWVETTAPLNASRTGGAGRFELFEPHATELGDIVALRTGAGDNANCFNLNSTAQPQLLAVDSAKLAARNAFRLKLPRDAGTAGWKALRSSSANAAIPALVDETTLLWALKRKVGDVLRYADENGRPFDVVIAGTLPDSLFQGYVLVDEQAFLKKFPSHPGYSVFLVDARSRDATSLHELRGKLEAAVRDAGGRVELTRDVLAAFHEIENTYIAIFNVLGSLGVILGSLGLAIVVARNLRERRGEFAVMSAIGIPRPVLARMVFSEFGRLVGWGIGIGVLSSALAIWPSLPQLPPAPTVWLVGGLLAGIVVLNLASGWAIFRWSLRDLRPGLEQAAG